MLQTIKLCNSFTLTRSYGTPMYRQGVISKNDKFQTIGFHSSSRLNPSLRPKTGDEAIECA